MNNRIYQINKNLKKTLNSKYKNGYSLYEIYLEGNDFILYLGNKRYKISHLKGNKSNEKKSGKTNHYQDSIY